MNKSIWKYQLEVTDNQIVKMPKDAEILSVQTQNEEVCLWALVIPNNDKEDRTFGSRRKRYEYVVDYKTVYHDSLVSKEWLEVHINNPYPEPTIEFAIKTINEKW